MKIETKKMHIQNMQMWIQSDVKSAAYMLMQLLNPVNKRITEDK